MLTRLPHRVQIQTLSTVSAGGGTFTETWATTATRWANVQIARASEEFSYSKDQQANTYRIIMRKESFTNKQRLLFGSLVLTIETVADTSERGRMMTLFCRGELT